MKFKNGDRVACHGYTCFDRHLTGQKGRVRDNERSDDFLHIRLDDGTTVLMLPERCRHLVPKKYKANERKRGYDLVMELHDALKSCKGEPSLHDLLRLAKRIKGE